MLQVPQGSVQCQPGGDGAGGGQGDGLGGGGTSHCQQHLQGPGEISADPSQVLGYS